MTFDAITSCPETPSEKPSPPLKYTIQSGDLFGSDVVQNLGLRRTDTLEQALRQIQDLSPRSGDTCVLYGGQLEIFRGNEKIGSFIVDERREILDSQCARAKADICQDGQACRAKLVSDIKATTSPVVPENTPPTETILPVEENDGKARRQMTRDEVKTLLLPLMNDLATGLAGKKSSTPIAGDTIASIIRRESRFNTQGISSMEARWLMGVREVVLEDMRERIPQYIKYFQKIPDVIIGQVTPEEMAILLQNIKSIACKPAKKITDEELISCQQNINLLKINLTSESPDPYLNCIVGSMYYASLLDDVQIPTPETLDQIIANIKLKKVNYYRSRNRETKISQPVFDDFFWQLRSNERMLREFIALSRYNGGNNPKIGTHPYYYATDILIDRFVADSKNAPQKKA